MPKIFPHRLFKNRSTNLPKRAHLKVFNSLLEAPYCSSLEFFILNIIESVRVNQDKRFWSLIYKLKIKYDVNISSFDHL